MPYKDKEKSRQHQRIYSKINNSSKVAYHKKRREENREAYREMQRKYRQSSHGNAIRNASHQRRRARKLNQLGPNPPTSKDYERLIKLPCYICHQSISEHIDHIVPLSKGGLHDISNVAGACKPCNLSKGNKLLSTQQEHMPKYKVEVSWTMVGRVELEAKTDKEMQKKVEAMGLHSFDSYYLEDSFKIDEFDKDDEETFYGPPEDEDDT